MRIKNVWRKYTLSQISYLWTYLRSYPRDVLIIISATIISICTILAIGQILKLIIDREFDTIQGQFVKPLHVLILITITIAVSAFYRILHTLNLSEKISRDILLDCLQMLLKCPYNVFESQSTGDLQNRVSVDIIIIKNFLAGPAAVGLRNAIQLMGSIILLFLASPMLSICIVAILPIIVIPIKIIGQKSRSSSVAVQDSEGYLNGQLQEILSGILIIKSFTAEKNFLSRIQLHLNDKLHLNHQQARYRSFMVAIVIILIFTCVICVIGLGVNQVTHQNLSPGNLTSFVFYAVLLINGTNNLTDILSQAHNMSGAITRIITMQHYEKELITFEAPAELCKKDGVSVNLNNVSFYYPQHSKQVIFNNISMTIQPGEKVAIVGGSGSGKSTLVKLLMGLYQPQLGTIIIDGYNTHDLSLTARRALFSYVPQDITLFNGTLLDNITLFNSSYTLQDVMQAARISLVDDFAKTLQQGYDTPLGPHGLKLSGGQRQRVALARALLYDAPVMLLDEATNALDNVSQTTIHQTLFNSSFKKTVIIITHQLLSIQHADHIYVISENNVLAHGRHDELLLTCPYYYTLFTTELQQNYSHASS